MQLHAALGQGGFFHPPDVGCQEGNGREGPEILVDRSLCHGGSSFPRPLPQGLEGVKIPGAWDAEGVLAKGLVRLPMDPEPLGEVAAAPCEAEVLLEG